MLQKTFMEILVDDQGLIVIRVVTVHAETHL